jgi:hypothetical protein
MIKMPHQHRQPHLIKSLSLIILGLLFIGPALTLPASADRQNDLNSIFSETTFYEDCTDYSASVSVSAGTSAASSAGNIVDLKDNSTAYYTSSLQPPYILEQYAIHVLKALAQKTGLPEANFVTFEHVLGLLAFMWREGGDINSPHKFNPLNTGIFIEGLHDDPPAGDGAQGFISFDAGVEATASTMLGNNQKRLAVVLADPTSNATQFMEALTYYQRYEANYAWASASQNTPEDPNKQDKYYAKMLEYVNNVRNDYKNIASTVIGSDDILVEEANANMHEPSKVVFNATTSNASTVLYASDNACNYETNNAAVAGNIAQTALNLAWPDKGHGKNKSDATMAYQTTAPQYNSVFAGADETSDVWSDCGAFVGTVMRASGADSNYPGRGSHSQLNYVSSHPEKYQIVDWTNTSQLQPGDVLVYSLYDDDTGERLGGHTYIYTGSNGNGFNMAEGSWKSHVPQAGRAYVHGGEAAVKFTLARLAK